MIHGSSACGLFKYMVIVNDRFSLLDHVFAPQKKKHTFFCVKNRVSCPWDHPLNHLLFKCYHLNTMLVGGLEHSFSPIVGMMIPSDFHIFQRVETTNQHVSMCGFSKSSRLASMSKPGKDGKGVDDVCLFFCSEIIITSSLEPPAPQ